MAGNANSGRYTERVKIMKDLANAFLGEMVDNPEKTGQWTRRRQIWHQLMNCGETDIVLRLYTRLEEYASGKPKEAIEHSGTIGHDYEFTPFPDKAPTTEAWANRYATIKKPDAPGGVN